MSGWLRAVGLGPGPAEWLTPEAGAILHRASDVIGYAPYVDALPATVQAKRHASGNGVELDRARAALEMAAAGARVAVVSGGDAGVFGMAAALFEAIESGDPAWRLLDIEVAPGMTAVLAAAARVGAPLGHDFCVISLSDRLKPWSIIERRLSAASLGDFVLALYNPAASRRREPLARALDKIERDRGPNAVAIVAADVGRPSERIAVTTLGAVDRESIDMRTLLLIGARQTRRVERPGRAPFVYTPRSYQEKP